MSIVVKPDRKRPSGGYAVLEGDIQGDHAWVTVFNTFSERYLGQHGWQSAKVEFGPYPVDHVAGATSIVIGPEIVNHVEEYAVLRLQVGDLTATINWPDTIQDRPGAALIGGIRAVEGRPAADLRARLVNEPVDQPDVLPEERINPPPVDETPPRIEKKDVQEQPIYVSEPPIDSDGEKQKRSAWLWLALGLVLLIAVAIACWFLFAQPQQPEEQLADETPAETEAPIIPPDPVPQVEEPVVADNCSADALHALSVQAFSNTLDAVLLCGSVVTPDTALLLVERASAANDPAALFLFGQLYDGQSQAEGIEDGIGLTFADSPAQAAEYYARAAAAGSDEANEALEAVCERLMQLSGTLVQNALEEHCPS